MYVKDDSVWAIAAKLPVVTFRVEREHLALGSGIAHSPNISWLCLPLRAQERQEAQSACLRGE